MRRFFFLIVALAGLATTGCGTLPHERYIPHAHYRLAWNPPCEYGYYRAYPAVAGYPGFYRESQELIYVNGCWVPRD